MHVVERRRSPPPQSRSRPQSSRSPPLSMPVPMSSTLLRLPDERPNTPTFNACPATPPVTPKGSARAAHEMGTAQATKVVARRFRYEDADAQEDDARSSRVEPCTLLFFVSFAAATWCALVRVALRRHRFPFHRHRLECTLLYAAPPCIFAGLLVLIDSVANWTSKRRRHRD
ncbi:hypothetical protein M885DRAFT_552739 [Pelagophyceae sp. CCMP2097]|nr:hypothetical protein M885DRAFT_552739 [Pelagophyceae sp. CCMP2097]